MTEEVIIDINLEQDKDNFSKLASLKSAITTTQQSVKELKDAYKAGNITLKEYTTEVVRLEANQKKLAAAYSDTQRKVTGLKAPFQGLSEQITSQSTAIDALIPGLGGAASGFINMAKSAMVFIATPLGAALAAVAVALVLVRNEMAINDEAADEYDKKMARLTATYEVFRRNIVDTVAALAGHAASIGRLSALAGIATGNAEKLTARQQALEDATNLLTLKEGALINQRDKLIIQLKNKDLTEKESIALNEKAAKIDALLTKAHVELARKRAEVDIETIGNNNLLWRKSTETLEGYAERLIKNSKIGGEDGAKIAAAIKSISEAENSSIKIQEKLQNNRDARELSAAAKREKALKDQEVASAKDRKTEEDAEKEEVKKFNDWKKGQDDFNKVKESNRQAANQKEVEETAAHNERMYQLSLDEYNREKALAELKSQLPLMYVDVLVKTANLAALIFGKNKELALLSVIMQQKESVSKVILNTMEANAKAVAASPLTFGQPWVAINTITAGISIATSLAAVAAQLEGFADGGVISGTRIMGHHGKPITRSNGDNRLVTVRTNEAILNEKQIARLGGPSALAAAGVPGYSPTRTGFATGGMGFETRSAFGQASQANAMLRLQKGFQQMKVAVIIEQVEALTAQRAQIRERANT